MIGEIPKIAEPATEADFNARCEALLDLHTSLATPKQTLVQINESMGDQSVHQLTSAFPRISEFQALQNFANEKKLKKPTKPLKLISKTLEKVAQIVEEMPETINKTTAKDYLKKILKTGVWIEQLEKISEVLDKKGQSSNDNAMQEERLDSADVAGNSNETGVSPNEAGSPKKKQTKEKKAKQATQPEEENTQNQGEKQLKKRGRKPKNADANPDNQQTNPTEENAQAEDELNGETSTKIPVEKKAKKAEKVPKEKKVAANDKPEPKKTATGVPRSTRTKKKVVYSLTQHRLAEILGIEHVDESTETPEGIIHEVIANLQASRPKVEEIVAKLTQESVKSVSELDFGAVQSGIQQLANLQVSISDLNLLDAKISIHDSITQVVASLFTDDQMATENQGIIDALSNSFSFAISNGIKDKPYSEVSQAVKSIEAEVSSISYDDLQLTEALAKFPHVSWIFNAQQMLKKRQNTMSIFEKIASEAPEEVKESEIFNQVVARSKGRNIVMTETDIYNRIQDFLDESDIVKLSEKIKLFIQDCRSIKIEDRSENLLKILEKTLNLFTEQDYTNFENLIFDLFEYKLHKNKTYQKLDQMKQTITEVNLQRGQISQIQNKQKLRIDALDKKSTNSVEVFKHLDKMDVEKATDMLDKLESVNKGLKNIYEGDIEILRTQISTSKSFAKEFDAFKKQYPLSKLLSYKEQLEADQLFKDFEAIVKQYTQVNLAKQTINNDLENYVTVLKGISLLRSTKFMGTDNHITTWKKILGNVEALSGGAKSNLASEINSKIQLASKFEKQVKEIKSSVGKSRADRASLTKLKDAKELLEEVHRSCPQINLGNSKEYLESTINSIMAKLEALQNDDSLMLHDLQNSLEYFKRAPLDLQHEIQGFIDKEIRGSEFLQQVRQLSPEGFMAVRQQLQQQYEQIGVKVMEWEDMIQQVKKEEQIVAEIKQAIDDGITDLPHCLQLRDKYKSNVKFLKDLKTETGITIIYLQLLKNEYEIRQDTEFTEGNKAVIDLIVLSALIGELEQLNFRLQTSVHSLKQEAINLAEAAKFIHGLYNEVKRYLQFNIYGLDLDSLNSNPPSKIFRNFVDITGPILDYKINLEIQEREKQEFQQQRFLQNTRQVKGGGLILQSKLEEAISPIQYAQPEADYNDQQLDGDSKDAKKGKKLPLKGTIQNNMQPDLSQAKPSVNRMGVTQELRNYYTRNWKNLMEENTHLDISGLDALMASKGLEKAIYDRIKRSPLDYDVLCTSITNTLKHIIGLKNISKHLRNENFKPNVLLLYCDKPIVHLRSLDKNIKSGGKGGSEGVNNFSMSQQPISLQNQIAPKYDGYQAEVNPNAINPLPEEEEIQEISYKNYRIFKGKLTFDLQGGKQKTLDDIELHTCSSYEKIIRFSSIPKTTSLKTNVSLSDFNKYIDQILKEPKKYILLTGWLSFNKNQLKASTYLKKNSCVASNQYSKNCKIFVFPLESLESRWLTQISVYTTTNRVEMLCMMIYKIRGDIEENIINPEPRPINTQNAFRLIPGHDKIAFKPSSLDRIKVGNKFFSTDSVGKYEDKLDWEL